MDKIVRETKELFDCEVHLTLDKMPKVLSGDEIRMKYILLSLIQKAVERKTDLVMLSVGVSDDEQIVLSQV